MQNVFNDLYASTLLFFYPGSVGWSAMCEVFPGHNHIFLKINVCNFLD